jgi:hypothetical protein
MKKALLILALAVTTVAAHADLGDTRQTPRHYPEDWEVTEVYNKEGKVIMATYAHKDGSHFSDKEVSQIFKRNNMPEKIWAYELGPEDNTATWATDKTVSFLQGDLGLLKITFKDQAGN